MDVIGAQALTVIATYGVRVVGVIVLFFVAWQVAGWVRRAIQRALARTEVEVTLARFLASTARWAIILFTGIGCLGVFGVETTSFAAVIGAAGVAIGLAFQGTLSNFAAGIMLMLFRPFRVGDSVVIAGKTGTVEEIDLFTTKLDTSDRRRFTIPNSVIFNTTIENVSHHPHRRVDVTVGVEYAADLDRTREVLESAAAGVPGQLPAPAPSVALTGLADSAVTWRVSVWAPTGEFGTVKQATIRAVKLALDAAGIAMPFPQLDVHLDSPPAPAGS